MRKVIACGLLVLVVATGAAWGHGPSGSYEGDRRHVKRNNNVRCRRGAAVAPLGTTIFAGAKGAEVCKDGGPRVGGLALEGRVMVSRRGYVAADGDRHNPQQARGYAMIDQTGPHCSDGRDQDSTHSRTKGNPQSCDAD